MMSQRPFTGRALAAVFNTYHEAPVRVLTLRLVPPPRKYWVTDGDSVLSSTMLGSAAPASPDVEAGPESPMVA